MRVSKHSRCPRCADRGADRHGDNLAIYDDGHSYCFACGYYGHPPSSSLALMAKKLYKHKEVPVSERIYDEWVDSFSYALPVRCKLWLYSFGITDREIKQNGFFFDNGRDLLVMPVKDGERIVLVNCRYFGTDPTHPKYVTKGYKNQHFKVISPSTPTKVWVLVEDYLSAIKVGRYANAIPLFGSTVPKELVLSLLSQKDLILRIWLDPDKSFQAIKEAAKARQFVANCATILSEHDPKEHEDDEIINLLKRTDAPVQHSTESSPEQGTV